MGGLMTRGSISETDDDKKCRFVVCFCKSCRIFLESVNSEIKNFISESPGFVQNISSCLTALE